MEPLKKHQTATFMKRMSDKIESLGFHQNEGPLKVRTYVITHPGMHPIELDFTATDPDLIMDSLISQVYHAGLARGQLDARKEMQRAIGV